MTKECENCKKLEERIRELKQEIERIDEAAYYEVLEANDYN